MLFVQAFSVAENELDIPALLDAEDMVALSVPDKLSIATYLVQYYNFFKDKAPSSQTPSGNVPVHHIAGTSDSTPPTKRTKVETIGPSDVPLPLVQKGQSPAVSKQTPLQPLPTNQKATPSPPIGQKTTPTHKPTPVKPPSPVVVKAATTVQQNVSEEKSCPSKESTPEPSTESAIRAKKGRKSKFKSTGASVKSGTMGMENCSGCGERVFLMERLAVEGHVFHRACFKCFTCKCLLKPGSYEHDSKADLFYCPPHYREAIRQSTLKRTMEQRGLTNGDEAVTRPTEVKKKKEDNTSSTTTSEKSPTSPKHDITREESQKIKASLPGLLKSLAGNKSDGSKESGRDEGVTSPKHKTVASPTKIASNAESAVIPAKPQPPQTIAVSSKVKSIESTTSEQVKQPTAPPRRPTWSPKSQPRELPKQVESPKAQKEPPRRPTWSPKVPHEPPRRPTWSPKVPHEPPRRPTWSPKVRHEPPKRPSKAPSESIRRPTWSPKVQPVEGERSRGELPKSTVAWMIKEKALDSDTVQSPPIVQRHATVSGIPLKPSPPITSRRPEEKKVVSDVIKEEPSAFISAAPSPSVSPRPVKPPRRRKTASKDHPSVTDAGEAIAEKMSPPIEEHREAKKHEPFVPKRVAPPRPHRPPSLMGPPVNGEWLANYIQSIIIQFFLHSRSGYTGCE